MDSVPGQTFLNYAYSWGASIVILGALFKLTHLPGGNLMLFLGMGTEAIVFFLAAFDRPFDKNEIGKALPDELETDEEIENKIKKECSDLSIGTLVVQAIATSIDALAIGVTLQMAKMNGGLALGAWGASGLIGIITLGLALTAVYVGKLIGNKLADKAGIFGGAVLLGIGVKILIEGLL